MTRGPLSGGSPRPAPGPGSLPLGSSPGAPLDSCSPIISGTDAIASRGASRAGARGPTRRFPPGIASIAWVAPGLPRGPRASRSRGLPSLNGLVTIFARLTPPHRAKRSGSRADRDQACSPRSGEDYARSMADRDDRRRPRRRGSRLDRRRTGDRPGR